MINNKVGLFVIVTNIVGWSILLWNEDLNTAISVGATLSLCSLVAGILTSLREGVLKSYIYSLGVVLFMVILVLKK